jgi:hydrogenase maturation protein HypF
VLSGGVFQNLNLQQQLKKNLEDLSFEVYVHRQVPANDGGLALGQAVAGRAIYERLKAKD